MIRVLFVCLGNICRSPMAEGIFQHKVREAGLEAKIESDSAGTGHWHVGERPHRGTQQILAKNGVHYDGRARLLSPQDLDAFDYILTMDESNWADVQSLGSGHGAVSRFLDFAPHTGVREVPDPYYTGGFEEVYRLCEQAAEGLLAHIRQEHGM